MKCINKWYSNFADNVVYTQVLFLGPSEVLQYQLTNKYWNKTVSVTFSQLTVEIY
jgi:hypothetical protein